MSTANRKLVYIDNELVEAKEGSVDFDAGGLEGEEEMAETGFAGLSMKQKAGRVKLDVVLNGRQVQAWWNTSIERDVLVEFPDVTAGTTGYAFSGMRAKTVFSSNGATASLEFVGPAGAPVQ